jgi:hypothetical protein
MAHSYGANQGVVDPCRVVASLAPAMSESRSAVAKPTASSECAARLKSGVNLSQPSSVE